MIATLDREFGPFLAHSPHNPNRFWGLSADAVLALFNGKTEQEVREEIAGISEETAMDLWWEACDNGWAVPDDLPSKYIKHVVREMNQRIARGGEQG